MGLRSKLFGDGTCSACSRYRGACICDRPVRVTTKGVKPVKPRSAAAPRRTPKGAPRACGQACGPKGEACPSTVRGGVCPCPACP